MSASCLEVVLRQLSPFTKYRLDRWRTLLETRWSFPEAWTWPYAPVFAQFSYRATYLYPRNVVAFSSMQQVRYFNLEGRPVSEPCSTCKPHLVPELNGDPCVPSFIGVAEITNSTRKQVIVHLFGDPMRGNGGLY